jgi:D-sedoheptulose 7-phosphate isomerase
VSHEPTGFLYPFIESDERDAATLVADLTSSALSKVEESYSLRFATLDHYDAMLDVAGRAMAQRFDSRARLFAFGNGGSATDADGTVDLFLHPPRGRPLPAMSLVDDRAVLTALANDVGFDLVFSRQIIAHAQANDIAVGFSTSGNSANVLGALQEASSRGLLTIGFSGSGGGAMSVDDAIDHCFVVRSESIHRIQETQDALLLELWSIVQEHLVERAPRD